MKIKDNVIFLVYLILSIFIYTGLFLYNFVSGVIICLPSHFLFIFLIIVIPIILLLLPLILEKKFKNKMKSLMLATSLSAMYIIIIIPLVHFSIVKYAEKFNIEKWNEMRFLKYLMIENLEDNYELVNMPIHEVKKILGKADKEYDNTLCYFIKDDIDNQFYCIKIENNIVINNFISN